MIRAFRRWWRVQVLQALIDGYQIDLEQIAEQRANDNAAEAVIKERLARAQIALAMLKSKGGV